MDLGWLNILFFTPPSAAWDFRFSSAMTFWPPHLRFSFSLRHYSSVLGLTIRPLSVVWSSWFSSAMIARPLVSLFGLEISVFLRHDSSATFVSQHYGSSTFSLAIRQSPVAYVRASPSPKLFNVTQESEISGFALDYKLNKIIWSPGDTFTS